jgi:hypothetical protein
MYELHLRQLEARRVREETPLAAAEVALRARELGRVHVRVRAGPRPERARSELTVVRQPRHRPSPLRYRPPSVFTVEVPDRPPATGNP